MAELKWRLLMSVSLGILHFQPLPHTFTNALWDTTCACGALILQDCLTNWCSHLVSYLEFSCLSLKLFVPCSLYGTHTLLDSPELILIFILVLCHSKMNIRLYQNLSEISLINALIKKLFIVYPLGTWWPNGVFNTLHYRLIFKRDIFLRDDG